MDAESLDQLYSYNIRDRKDPVSFVRGFQEYLLRIFEISEFEEEILEQRRKEKLKANNKKLILPFHELLEFKLADELQEKKLDLSVVIKKARKRGLRGMRVVNYRQGLRLLKSNAAHGTRSFEEAKEKLQEGKLRDVVSTVHGHLLSISTKKLDEKYWFTKEGNQYYFGGRPISVSDRGTQYFQIFETVFELCPKGGEIRYKPIIDILNKKGIANNEGDHKKIQKALTSDKQLFQFLELPFDPEGIPIFDAPKHGRYLVFNNKRL